MPGSPQATPGEAESSGLQEILKPLHTLEIPGRTAKRRERVSAVGRRREEASAMLWAQLLPQHLPLPHRRAKARAAGNEAGEETGR